MQIFPLALKNTYNANETRPKNNDPRYSTWELVVFIKKKKDNMNIWEQNTHTHTHFWNTICPSPLEIKGY